MSHTIWVFLSGLVMLVTALPAKAQERVLTLDFDLIHKDMSHRAKLYRQMGETPKTAAMLARNEVVELYATSLQRHAPFEYSRVLAREAVRNAVYASQGARLMGLPYKKVSVEFVDFHVAGVDHASMSPVVADPKGISIALSPVKNGVVHMRSGVGAGFWKGLQLSVEKLPVHESQFVFDPTDLSNPLNRQSAVMGDNLIKIGKYSTALEGGVSAYRTPSLSRLGGAIRKTLKDYTQIEMQYVSCTPRPEYLKTAVTHIRKLKNLALRHPALGKFPRFILPAAAIIVAERAIGGSAEAPTRLRAGRS